MISDIEGMIAHWLTLFRQGKVKYDAVSGRYYIPTDGGDLYYLGDLMRRGPSGRASYRNVLHQFKETPTKVVALIGNHDGNVLSFLTLVPSLDLGVIPEYEEYLAKAGFKNSRFNQME